MTHPGEELVTVQVKRTLLGIKGQARRQGTQQSWGPPPQSGRSYRGAVRQQRLDGEQSLQVGLAPAATRSAVNTRQGQMQRCGCGEGRKGPVVGTCWKF